MATEEITEETASDDGSATETAPELGDAGKKAIDRMKAERDEARKQLREHAKALDAEKAKGLSEAERAIAEAKAAGRTEATLEAGKRLARAEIRAAASEKGLDASSLLDDLDLSRFVGDDGEPNDKAIAKAIDRWAAITPRSTRPAGDVGQGNRGNPGKQDPRSAFAALFER